MICFHLLADSCFSLLFIRDSKFFIANPFIVFFSCSTPVGIRCWETYDGDIVAVVCRLYIERSCYNYVTMIYFINSFEQGSCTYVFKISLQSIDFFCREMESVCLFS